jgi:hypothetical protein
MGNVRSPSIRNAKAGRVSLLLALALFGLLAAFLLLECVLRLAGLSYPSFATPDVSRGHALRAGMRAWQTAEGEALVEINSQGLRDREHQIPKPDNNYRIALLGDSYAEAQQVALEKTFWWLLQTGLTSCAGLAGKTPEIINFGVSGYGGAQQLLTLREQVWRYQPDMVLLAFTSSNDVSDNLRELKQDPNVPYFTLEGNELKLDNSFHDSPGYQFRSSSLGKLLQWSVQHSRVLQLLNRLRYQQRQDDLLEQRRNTLGVSGDTVRIYQAPSNETWNRAWDITEAVLAQIARESQQAGAAFVLATLSNPKQVHPLRQVRDNFAKQLGVPDLFYPEQRLSALGTRAGFPVIALAPGLQVIAEARNTNFHYFNERSFDGHWNEAGHAAAAEILSPALCGILSRTAS